MKLFTLAIGLLITTGAWAQSNVSGGTGGSGGPTGPAVGCTSDGVNPTRCPNGINTAVNGDYEEYTVDTGGVTAGLALCATTNVDASGRPKVLPCSHVAANPGAGFVGIAKSTVAAAGTVVVCWTVNCSATFDNGSTALNEAIMSVTTDGQLHDTGAQTATAGQPNFSVLNANGGSGNSLISLTGMLAQNPKGGGGNGKGGGVNSITGDSVIISNSGSTGGPSGAVTLTRANANPNLFVAGPVSAGSSNLVQQAQTTNNSTTPITLAYPSNVTAGDLLIMTLSSFNGLPTSFTTSQSDTLSNPIAFTTHGTNYAVYYTCSAVGGATTVSAARSGNAQFIMHIYEFSGNTTTSCLDASLLTFGGSGTSSPMTLTTSGSVAQATELVFASLDTNNGLAGDLTSPGTGYTGLQYTTDTPQIVDHLLEEISNTTTGLSGAQTATFALSRTNVGINFQGAILTFKLNTTGSAQLNTRLIQPQDIPSGAVASGINSIGAQNISGCSLTANVGGPFAGSFASGTTGTCTVTITPGITAAHGFACSAKDLTTVADEPKQTAYTATTATLSWTTVSGDLITWSCAAF